MRSLCCLRWTGDPCCLLWRPRWADSGHFVAISDDKCLRQWRPGRLMGDNEGVIAPNECDPPLVSPLCPGRVQEGGGGGRGTTDNSRGHTQKYWSCFAAWWQDKDDMMIYDMQEWQKILRFLKIFQSPQICFKHDEGSYTVNIRSPQSMSSMVKLFCKFWSSLQINF